MSLSGPWSASRFKRCTGRTGRLPRGPSASLAALKRSCRLRCQQGGRSGLQLGLWCVGSSSGLMVVLLALGLMSLTWMAVITVIVLVQKVLPARALMDLPLAAAIVGFGLLII